MSSFTVEAVLTAKDVNFSNTFATASRGLEGFKSDVASGLTSIGSAFTSVGKIATAGLTVPLVGAFGKATKTGMEFEKQMSNVGAISMATDSEMQVLTETARELGRTTKFTSTEAGEGMQYLAQAGWDTTQIMEGIPSVLDLASASNLGLGDAASIVSNALSGFGMEAKEAGRLADVLAVASSESNTDVLELGEAFKYAAPLAGTLGYSVEDVSLALGLMANNGIVAGQAGNTVKNAMLKLSNPTDQAASLMEELGVNMFDAQGKALPFRDVLGQLREGFADLTEDQQMQAAETLFGTQAVSGMMAVINASEEDFNSFAHAVDNSNGSVKEMAETMMDNLAGSVDLMNSAISDAFLTIFEVIEPILRNIIEKITDLANAFNALPEGVQENIVKFGAFAAAIGPVSLVLGKVFTAMGSIVGVMPSLGAAFVSVVPMIGVLVAALGGIYMAFEEEIQGMLTTAKEKGPEIITSLADGITSKLPLLMEKGTELISLLAEAIAANLPALLTAGTDIVISLVEGIGANAGSLIESAVTIVGSLLMGVAQNLPRLIVAGGELILNLVSGVLQNIPQILSTGAEVISTFVIGVGENLPQLLATGMHLLWEIIKGIFMAIPNIIMAAGEIVGAFIQAFIEGLAGVVGKVAGAVTGFVSNIFGKGKETAEIGAIETSDAIGTGLEGASVHFDKAGTDAETMAGRFDGAFGSMGASAMENIPVMENEVLTRTQATTDGAINNASAMSQSVNDYYGAMSGGAVGSTESMASGVSSNIESATKKAESDSEQMSKVVTSNFDNLESSVNTSMGNVERNVSTSFTNIGNSVKNSTTQMSNQIKSAMSQIESTIRSAFSKINSQINSATRTMSTTFTKSMKEMENITKRGVEAISRDFTQGFQQIEQLIQKASNENVRAMTQSMNEMTRVTTSGMNEVVNAVRSGTSNSVNAVNSFRGSFVSAGSNMMAGLRSGIYNGRSGVINAAVSVMRSAVNAAKRAAAIRSPSRVFEREIGLMLPKGMAVGIDKGSRDVKTAVDNLMDDAINMAKLDDFTPDLFAGDGKLSHAIQESVNMSHEERDPAEIYLNMGGRLYRGFVDDIKGESDKMVHLEEAYTL